MDNYNLTCPDEQHSITTYSSYFKGDLSTVNAELLNKNLSDKKEGFPAGKYLPWGEDSDHQLHLNFEAAESDMYSIP